MSKAIDTTADITAAIIASLAAGEGEGSWKRTWNVSGLAPVNACTDRPYTGLNRFYLSMLGITYIATNKQWKKLDAAVQWDRKPAPTPIPLLRPVFVYITDDKTGKKEQRLTGFAGFNGYAETDQVGWTAPVVATLDFNPVDSAEALVKACGVDIQHGGDRAMHVDNTETVHMPVPERFDTVLEYYRVLMHEIIHWTSNKARCNRRDDNRKKYGTFAYAFEELIAEIGSTFLCGHLGLGQEEMYRTNHIKYIKHWMDAMKGDSSIIVKAASMAETACKSLLDTLPATKEVSIAA